MGTCFGGVPYAASRVTYLSTILDDFSRYIIAWKLCTSMKVEDATDTLDLALAASSCNKVKVERRPRLLSDNGPCYVASDLGEWLEIYKIDQFHGAAGHPQTQGKIERWHQMLKNRLLLENYSFQDTWKPRLRPSSSTTIIADITKASTISLRPTSTSGAATSSCSNVKGSNETQSDSPA
jgi:transposase InsO family protein